MNQDDVARLARVHRRMLHSSSMGDPGCRAAKESHGANVAQQISENENARLSYTFHRSFLIANPEVLAGILECHDKLFAVAGGGVLTMDLGSLGTRRLRMAKFSHGALLDFVFTKEHVLPSTFS